MAKEGKRKVGVKSPEAKPKTEAMFSLLKFLAQPRTKTEIAKFLYISIRGVYRYIKVLKNLGFQVYLHDKKYSILEPNISSIHFDISGKVVRIIYFDPYGQQVVRWAQEFSVINNSFGRFLPK